MSKKSESKELKNQETAGEMTIANDLSAWGENEMSSRDMVIPKILCMQGLSDLVSDGKAKMGDFVDSLSNEVIGNIDEPVNFIPFHMEKIYIISKRDKGASRFEFDRIEPVGNQDYPYEETIGNEEFKYEYTLQFYVLRPEDTTLPYVLSFKSTSLKAGKVLSTQMYVRNRAAGLVPPAYVMSLLGRKEKNDQGTFIVMDVKQGDKSTTDQISGCLEWLKIIKAGKAKVDHSSEGASKKEYASDETQF
jgi:hypothetical protein